MELLEPPWQLHDGPVLPLEFASESGAYNASQKILRKNSARRASLDENDDS